MDTAPPWCTPGRCRWWRCARRQLRAGWPVFQAADAVGHDAPVHVARRVIYAVGEQAGITGIESPVAPELAPWGYAERRLAFARPDLGRRRFHVVARHLQKARQFASLSRSAAYQPAILTRSRLVKKTSYTSICSVDRNGSWTTSGSNGFFSVSARSSPPRTSQCLPASGPWIRTGQPLPWAYRLPDRIAMAVGHPAETCNGKEWVHSAMMP